MAHLFGISRLFFREPTDSPVGELRGSEARTLLDAMNTGHDGTLTTVHASSAEGAVRRIAALAARTSEQITLQDAEEEVRALFPCVIQLGRTKGQRTIVEILGLRNKGLISACSLIPALPPIFRPFRIVHCSLPLVPISRFDGLLDLPTALCRSRNTWS